MGVFIHVELTFTSDETRADNKLHSSQPAAREHWCRRFDLGMKQKQFQINENKSQQHSAFIMASLSPVCAQLWPFSSQTAPGPEVNFSFIHSVGGKFWAWNQNYYTTLNYTALCYTTIQYATAPIQHLCCDNCYFHHHYYYSLYTTATTASDSSSRTENE